MKQMLGHGEKLFYHIDAYYIHLENKTYREHINYSIKMSKDFEDLGRY